MRLALALLLVPCATLAHAEVAAAPESVLARASDVVNARSSDSLIVSGQLDRISPGTQGGGGSIDWVRTTLDGATLTGGVASYSIADSRWAFGRAGGAVRPGEGVILQGQASLGRGRTADSNFTYRLFSAGLSYRTSPEMYLKAEDQYVGIGATRGHFLKAGVFVLPSSEVRAEITYARSAGGNLNSEFVSARVDWQTRHARFLGGLAYGRSVPDLFNVDVGSGTQNASLREFFGGVAVPVAGAELTIVLGALGFNEVRRRTLTLSVKFPLDRA